MNLLQLTHQGSIKAGTLEKFADGCNFLARSFWMGSQVEVKEDQNKFEFQILDNKTVTSYWMDAAKGVYGIYPIGVLISLIVLIAYVIVCIPVVLSMGIGLASKKIALKMDEKACLYNTVVQKYLAISEAKKKVDELEINIKFQKEAFSSCERELRDLEDIQISGKQTISSKAEFELLCKNKIESVKQRMETAKAEMARMEEQFKNFDSAHKETEKEIEDLLKNIPLNKTE